MDESALKSQLEAGHAESFAWALTCSGGHFADAQDLLQAVYLKILDGSAHFRGESQFKTWLFAVIRKTAAAEARKQVLRRLLLLRHEETREPMRASTAPDGSLEETERQALFRRALAELPSRQREVLHLVFYQSLTLDQAAEVMGISPGSARRHYERAKCKLRQSLPLQLEQHQ